MLFIVDDKELNLGKELFWDVALERVPDIIRNNPAWVLPRVLEYGELEEIDLMIYYYGEEKSRAIVKELMHELRPMGRAMARLFLDIPYSQRDVAQRSS